MADKTAAYIGTRLSAAPIYVDKQLGNLDGELYKLELQQPLPSLLPHGFCCRFQETLNRYIPHFC